MCSTALHRIPIASRAAVFPQVYCRTLDPPRFLQTKSNVRNLQLNEPHLFTVQIGSRSRMHLRASVVPGAGSRSTGTGK